MSVTVANVTPAKVQPLRQTVPPLSPVPQTYNLPALIDLALKTNPQTRRAWYAAQSANAQLGQAQASDYPTVAADADGGYLKLPIQFPGQTLVIRNEAFLPQIKVSYDLLDFGRTRATERGAREQLIAANFAFNRAIQDVVFNVEKAYYVLSAAKASVSAAEANLKLARTSLDAVHGAASEWVLRPSRKSCWQGKSRHKPCTISRTPDRWSTTPSQASSKRLGRSGRSDHCSEHRPSERSSESG